MKKEIFRSVALARMSSPDQLDQLVRVTSARQWIAILALVLLLGGAVVWSFVSRLPVKAEGRGVVMRAGSLRTVGALSSGQLLDVRVKVGDVVRSGQLVAMFGQPPGEDRVRAAGARLRDAEEDQRRQREARAKAVNLEIDSIRHQRGAIEHQISTAEQQIQNIVGQIPGYEELLGKGLVTRQQLLQLTERKTGLESNIAQLRSQLVQLDAAQFKIEQGARQADTDGLTRVTELRRDWSLLQDELKFQVEVFSPYSGRVIRHLAPGELVAPGTPIVTLQPDVEALEVVAFVPAVKAKEIRPGMTVEVLPAVVRVEEFGFMPGKVMSVDEYPSSEQVIAEKFRNLALAQSVSMGPVHEVRIELINDPGTPSGFKWSSGKGPPVKITAATVCTTRIVTREQAPITLVIPSLGRVDELN